MKNVISIFFRIAISIGFVFFTIDTVHATFDAKFQIDATHNDDDTYVTGITSDRAKSLIGVAAGLISLIIAWRVKSAKAGPRAKRSGAMVAFVLGLTAILFGVFHLSNVAGNFGTGGGKAGALAAIILGAVGTCISGMILRSKQN